ncbi:hypothetical protein Bca4012_091130 [Brassica carinata]|uniref:Uncharacterized protein n=2 Tax=Brassica TaxID=3705 RepID=A0ABQ8BJJ9_BRANA|nr:hypothetical protein Bca52824_085579 [Brassica carinata]KAH0904997.1 hypothetical protein HID58_044500 [Brassica napus]
MEKISAFLVILFLVSSCMVKVTVTMPAIKCQTDEDCVKKYGRCKVTGDLPICLHYYCSCYHEMHTPSLTTSNS